MALKWYTYLPQMLLPAQCA